MSKVTIELTSEQREQIRHETGDEVVGFTWERLESRDAPKVGGIIQTSGADTPGRGYISYVLEEPIVSS